jgi:aminodeoxyfutalosine deaminase
MFHTDLDAEYLLCHEAFGMGIAELADVARTGARAAYCSAELRDALLSEIDEVEAAHTP